MEIHLYNDRLFGAGLSCYHHFTHAFCNLTICSHFLFSLSGHLASVSLLLKRLKGQNAAPLNLFHYPQKVSQYNYNANRKLLTFWKDKAFNLVPNSRNERYSLFYLWNCPVFSGLQILFRLLNRVSSCVLIITRDPNCHIYEVLLQWCNLMSAVRK